MQQFVFVLSHSGISYHVGIHDGRYITAAVLAKGVFKWFGGYFVKIVSVHIVVGFLNRWLQGIQHVPCALRKVVIRLGQNTVTDHSGNERIPT